LYPQGIRQRARPLPGSTAESGRRILAVQAGRWKPPLLFRTAAEHVIRAAAERPIKNFSKCKRSRDAFSRVRRARYERERPCTRSGAERVHREQLVAAQEDHARREPAVTIDPLANGLRIIPPEHAC